MTSRIILILILATARLSEGEIVTTVARFRMMPRFQRLNAMIKQARLAAPDHHIAMLQQQPLQRLLLEHGDVVVWGGESRLFYHGIQPLKAGHHPETGDCRYNLTFRQAGGRQY